MSGASKPLAIIIFAFPSAPRNKRVKFIAAFASRRLSYALYKGAGLHLTVRFHVNSIHTSIGVDQVGSVGEVVHHSGVFVDQQ